jgi:hypothetical protein
MKAMGLRELEHAIELLTLTLSMLLKIMNPRELTLRLNLGVQEQLIKDSGERSNGGAEK